MAEQSERGGLEPECIAMPFRNDEQIVAKVTFIKQFTSQARYNDALPLLPDAQRRPAMTAAM